MPLIFGIATVSQDCVEFLLGEQCGGALAVFGGDHDETGALQGTGDGATHLGIVVREEHARRRARTLPPPPRCARRTS